MTADLELRSRLQATLGEAYTIERELGGGGMSRVFAAHENALSRKVVVKVVAQDLAEGVSVDRFNREIMMAAGLQHPHIVGVLSAGETDGLPFFIMPFVEGDSLRDRLAGGPLPVPEAVSVLRDVGRALGYAHERGIVHRDVKPDNVMLSHGAASIMDFGVAKALGSAKETEEVDTQAGTALTRVGTSVGTPAYMAPEQAAGEDDIDHRADIYALGITAYEMLAGKPPFHDRPTRALMAAHLTERPPPLEAQRHGVPAALVTLVNRCLEKEPADRPQSAAELVDALADPAVVSGETKSAVLPAAPSKRPRWMVWVAPAAVVVVAAGWWLLRGAFEAAPAPERSIAVLPLVNVGGDTADTYFADGMTDELITALQRVPDLRVASRTAAFSMKGSTSSPQDIGRQLNVSTLLEGTVRRGGDRLRLTAQLVNADDGFALWSQTFETDMQDVFAVQDSIARSIVGALTERFGGAVVATEVETPPATEDLEAYDLYLRGRYFFAQRGADALRRSVDFFERAIERDSQFAEAYTGLADAYGLLPLYSATPPDSVIPAALAAANRAISLDSTLAAAYASRGNLRTSGWNWEEAEADFRRALELDPEYATARQWLGELMLVVGRNEDAERELGQATRLDPLSPVMAGSHATALVLTGRRDSAMRQARRAVELSPSAVTHMMLGNTLIYSDSATAAAREFERAVVFAEGVAAPKGMLGYAYARAGRADTANAILVRLQAEPDRPGNAVAIARIHLGFDRPDSAMHWLSYAVERRDPFFNSEGLAAPAFDQLRRDPRFRSLVRRLRLDPRIMARER